MEETKNPTQREEKAASRIEQVITNVPPAITNIPESQDSLPMETDIVYNPLVADTIREAKATEKIIGLDLTGLPIVVDIANINLYSNDEYALARRDGFGASDSSVILGVNPFTTLEELIKQKASTTISADERKIGELVSVRKGLDLEPLIIKKFEQYFKQVTIKPKDMYKMINYPYLKINFDGVTVANEKYVPAEIKVVTMSGERHYATNKAMFNEMEGFKSLPEDVSRKNWSIESKAGYYGIPPYYYTQLQAQMMALDAPFGHLSVLLDKEWRFYSYYIWRDQPVINALITEGYKAWQRVLQLRGETGWIQPTVDPAGLASTSTEPLPSTPNGKDQTESVIQYQPPSHSSKDY